MMMAILEDSLPYPQIHSILLTTTTTLNIYFTVAPHVLQLQMAPEIVLTLAPTYPYFPPKIDPSFFQNFSLNLAYELLSMGLFDRTFSSTRAKVHTIHN